MADAFIAEIRVFPYSYVPAGWLLCDGTEYNINDYQALYALIGTYYGKPSSSAKFCVPDLRGRAPMGVGTQKSSYGTVNLGDTLGNETSILTAENLPAHTHTITSTVVTRSDSGIFVSTPTKGVSWLGRFYEENDSTYTNGFAYFPQGVTAEPAPDPENPVAMDSRTLSACGAGNVVAISTLQPYYAMLYCICYDGTFPMPA